MSIFSATVSLLLLATFCHHGGSRDDDKPKLLTTELSQEIRKEFDKNPSVAAKKYNGTKWYIDGRITHFQTQQTVMVATEYVSFPLVLTKSDSEKVEKGTAYRFTVTMRAKGVGDISFHDAAVGEQLKDFESHIDRKNKKKP